MKMKLGWVSQGREYINGRMAFAKMKMQGSFKAHNLRVQTYLKHLR